RLRRRERRPGPPRRPARRAPPAGVPARHVVGALDAGRARVARGRGRLGARDRSAQHALPSRCDARAARAAVRAVRRRVAPPAAAGHAVVVRRRQRGAARAGDRIGNAARVPRVPVADRTRRVTPMPITIAAAQRLFAPERIYLNTASYGLPPTTAWRAM